jgi:hypothetical protein
MAYLEMDDVLVENNNSDAEESVKNENNGYQNFCFCYN